MADHAADSGCTLASAGNEPASWGACDKAPVLQMGAVNVLAGRLAKFCSTLGPIKVEHLLASCAVPNIFPAVGNVSLFQPVDSLSVLNDLYLRGAFRPGFEKCVDLEGPIRIRRGVPDDEPRPCHIPFIEMSAEKSERLDYESKLDRSASHIEALLADGERQARVFVEQFAALQHRQPAKGHDEDLHGAAVSMLPAGGAGAGSV